MSYDSATNEELLAQQARRESSARTYPRSLPLAVAHADGATVEDVDGDRYYDCLAGAGALALGHNHPAVTEAMERLLERDRPLHTLDVTTPEKEAFVDSLFASLPDEFADRAKVQFCSPAGTDAVEAALKLVRTATGERPVFGFHGAYHGMTAGAMALMGDTDPKGPLGSSDVHHLPYPYDYRPPMGLSGETGHRANARLLERTLDDPASGVGDPAGVILEPVQGEGGAVPAPTEWLREVRRVTRERDVPLVVDEVQTGLGRTGERWGFEHADIVPDVVTVSKAVGGGLPLAVVIYDEELDAWDPGAHAGTFRGNQLAMAAGRATIEYVLENDLHEHAAEVGAHLRDRFESLADRHEAVGDVRGRGLMLGVEFVDPGAESRTARLEGLADPTPPADGDFADRVQAEAFDRGLIVETGGRDGGVVRFLPPLTLGRAQADEIADIFSEAVAAAAREEVAA